MERIISKDVKTKTTIYKNITIVDGLVLFIALLLSLAILSSKINGRIFIAIFIDSILLSSMLKINEERIYETIFCTIRHFILYESGLYRKLFKKEDVKNEMLNGINNLTLTRIYSIPFALYSEQDQDIIINKISVSLRSLKEGKWAHIISKDEVLDVKKNIEIEDKRIQDLKNKYSYHNLSRDEFLARFNIINERIDYLSSIMDEKIKVKVFYLVTLIEDRDFLHQVLDSFDSINLSYDILSKEEKEDVLKDYFKMDENSDIKLSLNKVTIDKIDYSYLIINSFPLINENGYLEDLMKIENTTATLSFTSINKEIAKKKIDSAILEVESRSSFKASKIIDSSTYVDALNNLLSSITNNNETYHDFSLIIRCLKKDKKEVVKTIKELGFSSLDKIGRYYEIHFKHSFLVSSFKDYKSVSSKTLVASFPFNSLDVNEESGLTMGVNDKIISIDFLKRDDNHLNSNMVVIGKSGSGKSYFSKNLILNLSTLDTKVFILDPEGEYLHLTNSLHGEVMQVGDKEFGIINPFEIMGEKEMLAFCNHLQFLEEFYRTLFVGISGDGIEKLNMLTIDAYKDKGIDKKTNLISLKEKDYPTFQDIYKKAKEIKDNEEIIAYLNKVVEDGMFSSMLNGTTTFKNDRKIIDFSFVQIMQSKNKNVINALMLLILKYLENEIIKGKDLKEKTVIVIDEAHLFIDEKYPVALDFMYEMAKRIRKYNGMQIIITQNLKDFCLSEDIKRKSMAIISVSQYSLFFSLAPADLRDLIELYRNSLNEKEIELIATSKLGHTFFIKSPIFRTFFKVVTSKNLEEKFI